MARRIERRARGAVELEQLFAAVEDLVPVGPLAQLLAERGGALAVEESRKAHHSRRPILFGQNISIFAVQHRLYPLGRRNACYHRAICLTLAVVKPRNFEGCVARELFALNPGLDRKALSARFRRDGRVQVRDVLTDAAAVEIHDILARGTPWGMAWQAGADGPNSVRSAALNADPNGQQRMMTEATTAAAQRGDFAFQFAQYPILDAYLGKWVPDGAHDLLLEHINAEEFLGFIRDVTGIESIRKGDAQATLYAPGHFLGLHSDSHVAEGWRIAYVLNFCREEWKPDWGGYLNFYDDDGDIIAGFRPRFNALNMFSVPRDHSVSYVPPFAPVGRFAITGWFRDR